MCLAVLFVALSLSSLGFVSPSMRAKKSPKPLEDLATFSVQAAIDRDGSVAFSEYAQVEVKPDKPQHGYARMLPAARLDASGKQVPIAIKNVSAMLRDREQALFSLALPVSTAGKDPRVHWFLTTLKESPPPGNYQFAFDYVARGIIQVLPETAMTGLIWDVTGPVRNEVDSAQITLKLPPFVDPASVRYSGIIGSSASKLQNSAAAGQDSTDLVLRLEGDGNQKDVSLFARTKRTMLPGEHFVIKVFWPSGFLSNGY
jgi:hypothetical protein